MADDDPTDMDRRMAEFRKGVGSAVREDDAQTHFDLALAYAEMGLWRDARSELEMVLRHQPGHAGARATLSVIEVRLGEPPSRPIGTA